MHFAETLYTSKSYMEFDPLLEEIEMALSLYGIGSSTFGVAAINDPTLVGRMRKGRRVKKTALRDKIQQTLARLYEKGTLA